MTPPLALPRLLARLIAEGAWPSANGPSMGEQQARPSIPPEWVRRFAPGESVICLQPPPFRTIAQYQALGGAGDFWEQSGALGQIDPELALVIGDFGVGSDSPVVLDFAQDMANPPVLYLRWGTRDGGNEWTQGAYDFGEFAAMLGIGG